MSKLHQFELMKNFNKKKVKLIKVNKIINK